MRALAVDGIIIVGGNQENPYKSMGWDPDQSTRVGPGFGPVASSIDGSNSQKIVALTHSRKLQSGCNPKGKPCFRQKGGIPFSILKSPHKKFKIWQNFLPENRLDSGYL